MEPTAPLLVNWPQGFSDHVEQRLRDGDPNATSAPERLGNWYQRLMRFRGPAYDPLKEVVGRTIEREFSGFHPGTLVSSATREWLPAKEAASHLGISSQRLVAAVQKQEIAGKITQRGFGHNQVVVPRFDVSNVAADRQRFWSGKKCREYLGLGRKQFNFLRDIGVIVELPTSERPALVDGGYYSETVKELVDSIRSDAMVSVGDTIAFSHLTLQRTTDREALKKLFNKICDGSVRPTAVRPETKLADFKFLKSEVERVLRSERHSLDWTANDIAKLTGWKAQCVTHWCREGLLDSRTVPHGNGVSYLISPASLAEFQSRFVPVVTLAKAQSTTSRKLLSDFANRKVPTYGAEREGNTSRGHLVKLTDLISCERSSNTAA